MIYRTVRDQLRISLRKPSSVCVLVGSLTTDIFMFYQNNYEWIERKVKKKKLTKRYKTPLVHTPTTGFEPATTRMRDWDITY